MKTIKIKNHFSRKVINLVYDEYDYNNEDLDTCKYVKLFMKSCLNAFLLSAIVFVATYSTAQVWVMLGILFFNNIPLVQIFSSDMSLIVSIGIGIHAMVLGFLLIVAIDQLIYYLSEKKRLNYYKNKERVTSKLYDSFKNKYCVKIELLD